MDALKALSDQKELKFEELKNKDIFFGNRFAALLILQSISNCIIKNMDNAECII